MTNNALGQWLKDKSAEERLSLRQMATKVGVSHQAIAGLINGKKALPQTLKKLAVAFGGNYHQRLALEDKLLGLAGYRTERPEEALSVPLAKLVDTAKGFSEAKLKMLNDFAVFLKEEVGD